MILQFHTGNVSFFPEDQAYFEKRFTPLKKFLGSLIGDEDTVQVTIHIEKNKHKSGDRFESKAHMKAKLTSFDARVDTDTIQKCADLLTDKLKEQIKTYKEKHK